MSSKALPDPVSVYSTSYLERFDWPGITGIVVAKEVFIYNRFHWILLNVRVCCHVIFVRVLLCWFQLPNFAASVMGFRKTIRNSLALKISFYCCPFKLSWSRNFKDNMLSSACPLSVLLSFQDHKLEDLSRDSGNGVMPYCYAPTTQWSACISLWLHFFGIQEVFLFPKNKRERLCCMVYNGKLSFWEKFIWQHSLAMKYCVILT